MPALSWRVTRRGSRSSPVYAAHFWERDSAVLGPLKIIAVITNMEHNWLNSRYEESGCRKALIYTSDGVSRVDRGLPVRQELVLQERARFAGRDESGVMNE